MKKLWAALTAAAMVGLSIWPAHAQDKTIKLGI